MNRRIYAGLIMIVSVSAIIIGVILSLNPNGNYLTEEIQVEFHPKQIKSCPGHTAWLLVSIMGVKDPVESLSISIQTNQPIQTDYVLWPNASPQVLEVFLYPNSSHINSNIEIEVQVAVGTVSATDEAIIHVIEWEIPDMEYFTEFRDAFVQYLARNHPEFGINETVTWTPNFNAIEILVVEHVLFISESWEMELSRHVMIQPYDWVQVYIRPRGALTPTWAGKIDSWTTDNQVINEITPPEEIYR